MSLKAQLTEDMKSAMKAGDKDRLKVVRLMLADIKRVEIDSRQQVDEAGVLRILEKAVKQRRDSIEQFDKGGREDLSAIEKTELDIIQTYLPEQLSRDDIRATAQALIAQLGAQGPRQKGKVMGPLMADLRGKADGRLVNEVVDELLSAE